MQPGQRQCTFQCRLLRQQTLQQRRGASLIERLQRQVQCFNERLRADGQTLLRCAQLPIERLRQSNFRLRRQRCGEYPRRRQTERRIRVVHHQTVLAVVEQGFGSAFTGLGQILNQTAEQRVHWQLHLFGERQNQRPLQQWRIRRLLGIDLQNSLPVLGRQGQVEYAAGVPVGVIGIGGEKCIRLAVVSPPGEARRRPGHLHQAQTTVLHDQAQAIANLRVRSQRWIGDAQRQQATGGLLDAAVRVAQQIIEGGTEQRLRTVIQTQADIRGIRRQTQWRIAADHVEALGLGDLPAFTGGTQAHSQGIGDFAILHQLRRPLARGQSERRQWQVIDAAVQSHRHTLFVTGIVSHQFSLDRFLCLTESEHAQLRLIALAEFARPAPLQVQRFFRTDKLLLLPDLTVIGNRPRGDAPAGQRVRHLEGEAGFAVGAGQQLRLPRSGVDVFTARTLKHFHAALAAIGLARCAGAARQCHVVADE